MSDLLSGLANLTKQVTSNISTYEIRKLSEKVQGMVMNYTEAENLVREATNEDPWGPTGPQMKEIAHLTFQYEVFHQVMSLLWKRMLEDNKYAWRRVYKSLTLLNYLLQHGSERVLSNARDHVFQMRSLEHYKHIDDKGKDQGINIRHRAKIILELLNDDDKLRAERKKAKSDNKERYHGYTSEDMRMGRAGSYSGNLSSNYRDDWKSRDTSPKRKASFDDDQKGDFTLKEVNSFQFPDQTRKNSLSPELGFRQDPSPTEDDGFGDFASARSTSQPTQIPSTTGTIRSTNCDVPAIPPPGGVSVRTETQNSFDLLNIAEPVSNVTDFFATIPSVNTQPNNACVSRQPRPPSGCSVSPLSGAVSSQTNVIDDIFGQPVNTPKSGIAQATDIFLADWSSAPTSIPSQPSTGGFAFFNGLESLSTPTPVSTPKSTPIHQSNNGLADIFGGLRDTDITPSVVPPLIKPEQICSSPKPAPTTKIGSTWAGASGLINLDNLGLKGGQVKQNPSLNQIQQSKQGSNNMPW